MGGRSWQYRFGRGDWAPFVAMSMGKGWDKDFDFNFGPGGRGGGGRRGRGRKRMFDAGELRLVLLHLLSEKPRHGYDLIREIEEMTGGGYSPSPGTVYPTLQLLEEMDLIEEIDDKTSKRLFSITKEGKTYLAKRTDEIETLMGRLERHGAKHERVGRPELKKAIANVMTAMWHKVATEEADEETLAEIAAILDKAAKKIAKL
ncbi:PadR family transcriptional regulator [Sphingomicrobium marinum]|uniref:PadR family transcriptional regulator n=1 Tax=Sphingomicrobium marinum TaxID=1227950 RepID=UPI00223F46C1|nr:PadR family transcriptional regulator [Sphingomicrobium marinum]